MKSKHDFPTLNIKEPEGVKPGGKPYNVMIVDDKEFSRKKIAQILESEGYKIVAMASNGQEALGLYEKHAKVLDLITTALDMPVLDGYAFIHELSEKKPKASIVFISEDTTKGVVEDLLQMGAADFILKPLERVRLLKRVKLALRKNEQTEKMESDEED